MISSVIPQSVYNHFGFAAVCQCEMLGYGLINNSYKVTLADGKAYFLQRINTSIFTNPITLQENYVSIEEHFSIQGTFQPPKPIRTISGVLLYNTDNKSWRCFEFLTNTYSPKLIDTPEQAYQTAHCFGLFTASLHNFDSRRIQTVLPHFHDLSYRYKEFTQALRNASPNTSTGVKNLIDKIEEHHWLVKWFDGINADKVSFPLHILHHDCKVSNILFDVTTNAIRCPVDLDTTQPGLFFSDIGDMMRTIVPNKDENERDIESIQLRPVFFDAVINGYLDVMSDYLTKEEKNNLSKSGMLLAYMQAMRFLTDYLNGNIYYKTEYAEQNKDRAANQLQLLQLFQEYAKSF